MLGPSSHCQQQQNVQRPNYVFNQARLMSYQQPPSQQAHVSQFSPNSNWQNIEDQPTLLPQIFSSLSFTNPENSSRIMDTDATGHIHSNGGILESISNNHRTHFIYVGNWSKMPVNMTEHTTFPVKNPFHTLHLHNVLIRPNTIKNLVFVSKFTRDNKHSIEFDEFGFTVKDYKNNQPLIRCDSSDPLYDVTPSSSQVLVASSLSLWHQRLGHPGGRVLKYLLSNNSIIYNKGSSSLLCVPCQLGKFVSLPFFRSNNVASNIFDIIHFDIWTSPVSSISRIRYYVIFLAH